MTAPTFARKPIGAIDGSIWRRPNWLDLLKQELFGWHLVHGGTFHPEHGWTHDREYFPPRWLVWVKARLGL